jgi:hypothetical protein
MKNKFEFTMLAAGVISLATGCTFTRETTTINTPALYNVSKDVSGALQTNLVAPASVATTVRKERLQLPNGYALLLEDDMFGMKLEMTSLSSTLPNLIMGQHHGSARWIPTSTNQLYAASMAVDGSIDNKAVPFWMSSKGTFTAGPVSATQTTDTNGVSSSVSAIVPGTPK